MRDEVVHRPDVILPGQLHEDGAGRVLRDVAALFDGFQAVAGPMHHQGRDLDRRQHVTDVRVADDQIPGDGLTGTRRQAREPNQGPDERGVSRDGRREHLGQVPDEVWRPPPALYPVDPREVVLLGPRPRVVGRPETPHGAVVDGDAHRALRIRGREQEAERGSALDPEQARARTSPNSGTAPLSTTTTLTSTSGTPRSPCTMPATSGVQIGRYAHMVGSLHLYARDQENAKTFLSEGWQSTTMEMPEMPEGRSSGSSTHLGHQARGGDALEHPWRGFLHRGGGAYQTGCSGARPRFLHPTRPGRGRPPRLRDPGAPAPQAVGGGADCPPGTRRPRDGLSGDGRRGGHSPACLGTNGPTPKIHTGHRNGRRRRGGSVLMGSLIPGRSRAVAPSERGDRAVSAGLLWGPGGARTVAIGDRVVVREAAGRRDHGPRTGHRRVSPPRISGRCRGGGGAARRRRGDRDVGGQSPSCPGNWAGRVISEVS